jgi:hypothetical protein
MNSTIKKSCAVTVFPTLISAVSLVKVSCEVEKATVYRLSDWSELMWMPQAANKA